MGWFEVQTNLYSNQNCSVELYLISCIIWFALQIIKILNQWFKTLWFDIAINLFYRACMCMCACVCVHVYVCMCMCACVCVHVYVCMCGMCVCMCMCVHVYVCMCVCMCMCVYVCACVYGTHLSIDGT